MKTKEELKLLFERGDKPKQEDFWEWQDSYWHKNEKIDMAKIAGLENGLPNPNHIYTETDEEGSASLQSYLNKKMFVKPGTVTIPDTFAYNMSISELSIPDSVTSIGIGAFKVIYWSL